MSVEVVAANVSTYAGAAAPLVTDGITSSPGSFSVEYTAALVTVTVAALDNSSRSGRSEALAL